MGEKKRDKQERQHTKVRGEDVPYGAQAEDSLQPGESPHVKRGNLWKGRSSREISVLTVPSIQPPTGCSGLNAENLGAKGWCWTGQRRQHGKKLILLLFLNLYFFITTIYFFYFPRPRLFWLWQYLVKHLAVFLLLCSPHPARDGEKWWAAKADPTPHRCYVHVALHNEKASQSSHRLFKLSLGKEISEGALQECFQKMYEKA